MKLYQEAFVASQIRSLFVVNSTRPIWVDMEEELNAPFGESDYLSQQKVALQNSKMFHTNKVYGVRFKREKNLHFS